MKVKIVSEKYKSASFLKNILMHYCKQLTTGFFSFLGEKRYGWIVKLWYKEQLDKEQLDNSEPFTLTNMQVHLIISKQIGCGEQLCNDQKVSYYQVWLYCNEWFYCCQTENPNLMQKPNKSWLRWNSYFSLPCGPLYRSRKIMQFST